MSQAALDEIRLMRWLIPAIGLAALCNGIVFWLRRVGWLERETYWLPYQRLVELSRLEGPSWERHLEILQFGNGIHELAGVLWLSKLPKEIVWIAFLMLALRFAPRALAQPRMLMLAYAGLFVLAGLSAVETLIAGRWVDVLAGGRAFFCWALAALGVALTTPLTRLAISRVFVWVLVIQGLMAPLELTYGLTTYSMTFGGTDYPRVVGSFALPVSLGIFAVVAWAIAICWGDTPHRQLKLLTLLVAVTLVANASATAWIAFAASLSTLWLNRQTSQFRVAVLLLCLPAGLLAWQALPHLTGRSDIHDSLYGRVLAVQVHAAETLSPREILLGHGFGLGTNAHTRLSSDPLAAVAPIDWTVTRAFGDSLPASLIWQVGIVGMLIVYGLLIAGLAMRPADQAIGVVIVLASLTLNISELFPVNLILGLWLAAAWKGTDNTRENPLS